MSAIQTKDHLLELLRVDDPNEKLDNCDAVMTALELTLGLWVELNYAYKGDEIIGSYVLRIIDEAKQACGHWKRHRRLDAMRERAYRIKGTYHDAQQRKAA